MDKNFFAEEINYLQKLFRMECPLPSEYYDKYDHFKNERFHKIVVWLRDNYNFEYGKHFPTISDFEKARTETHEENTFKCFSEDIPKSKEYADIVQGIIEQLNKRKIESTIEMDPQSKRKSIVNKNKFNRKLMHKMEMVWSYREGKYVNKSNIEIIGGQFKDTFTGEEFSFIDINTEPKF